MSLTLRQSCPSLRRLARAAFGHSSFLSYFFGFVGVCLWIQFGALYYVTDGGDPCPCHRDWRAAGRGEPMTWCNLTLMEGGGEREWLHSSDDLCKTRSHLPSPPTFLPVEITPSRRSIRVVGVKLGHVGICCMCQSCSTTYHRTS